MDELALQFNNTKELIKTELFENINSNNTFLITLDA